VIFFRRLGSPLGSFGVKRQSFESAARPFGRNLRYFQYFVQGFEDFLEKFQDFLQMIEVFEFVAAPFVEIGMRGSVKKRPRAGTRDFFRVNFCVNICRGGVILR
jgi:hypothetical protein